MQQIKYLNLLEKGNVSSVSNLHGTNAEIIEFVVKSNTKITSKPINQLNFPSDSIIAGVIRKWNTYNSFWKFSTYRK